MENLKNLKSREKSSWGGTREGSGRKPSEHNSQTQREIFENLVDASWAQIVTKMIELALRGNEKMLTHLVDHRIGKAPQPLVGDKDNPIGVIVYLPNAAGVAPIPEAGNSPAKPKL